MTEENTEISETGLESPTGFLVLYHDLKTERSYETG